MNVARTNEERFVISCESAGEADVRQKLSSGQYSENRTLWANSWLEQRESGKSDATRAEERSVLSRNSSHPSSGRAMAGKLLFLFVALAGAILFLILR